MRAIEAKTLRCRANDRAAGFPQPALSTRGVHERLAVAKGK
jgi:hypothetical protein